MSIVAPITIYNLQVRKINSEKLNYLHKVAQLINTEARIRIYVTLIL